MAFINHNVCCSLIGFALQALVAFHPLMQVHGIERSLENAKTMDGGELCPTRFVVLDIQLSGEDNVSLSWSDLGSNFVYTVEYCDSLAEGDWAAVPPVEQWPTANASWTGVSAIDGTRFYRIYTEALYDPPSPPSDVTAGVEDGEVVITWSPVAGAFSHNVYWSTDAKLLPVGANKVEDVTSPFRHSGLDYGVTYYYVVTAVGNKGESEVSDMVTVTLAPPLDTTVATTLYAATEFLYTGDNPIQTGVAPGTIEPKRVAVLRGKVFTRDGKPLYEVTITALNHPEYGQTLSRGDGTFNMAVNGGGFLTVDYQKDGYLPAQRQVDVPWQDYIWLPDVVLIPVDTQVTAVDFSEPMQVAQGSPMTDDDGTRQATLLFPQGTQAEMVMPDGSTQPISSLSVRATEYTVGENGPEAMPALLPPTSFYTYCVELTADEAQAAGAKGVVFSEPIPFYVENFLGFAVGLQVPTGLYDRDQAAWIPIDDGKVIGILSIAGGLAELDTTGDGVVDNGAALGVTDAEREWLATLYAPGQTLWRVAMPHFSPADLNLPIILPAGSAPPDPPPARRSQPEDDPCEGRTASVIEYENQILGERIPVTCTPFTLNYRSDRVLGRTARLEIPLSGDTIPSSLKRIVLKVWVAGRAFSDTFPAEANQTHEFTWDRQDGYGRTLQGLQPVTIGIGYVYELVYAVPASLPSTFGLPGGVPTQVPGRMERTLWQTQHGWVGTSQARGLGGWTLSVHHAYDSVGRVLYRGEGKRRSTSKLQIITTTVAGTGESGDTGDGGPATEARLNHPTGVAIAPDGTVYIADGGNSRVRQVGPDGIITTVAGTEGWGGADVAVGPDGSLYATASFAVLRVGPDGQITVVAGGGSGGDGGPATEASLAVPWGVAAAPDGSLYISEFGWGSWSGQTIRRVGPDGIITTVAGTQGVYGFGGDGGPATAARLNGPRGVAVGPDGSLYIADSYNNRIRRVGPDGIITTVAGTGFPGSGGDGGPATEAQLLEPYSVAVAGDGSLYICDTRNDRVRRVGPNGIIGTVAGTGTPGFSGDGGPAAAATLRFPRGIAVGPDGNLYIADSDNDRVRRMEPALPGFEATDILIPSEDGNQLFVFDSGGRHLRTLHALTGAVLYEFRYDQAGLLSEVEDADGNLTIIERDAEGKPTAIVAPFGQRTTLALDANGYLSSIANPAGETIQLRHTGGGLLEALTHPRGNSWRFEYDESGRLTKTEDPAGGPRHLVRTSFGNSYEVSSTTALGVTTRYRVERLDTGQMRRLNTFPDGAQTDRLIGTDGSATTMLSDGMVTTLLEGPDPRFGMQAPLTRRLTIATPGGLTRGTTIDRQCTLADPHDLMSVTNLTETLEVNGRAYGTVFDAASLTFSDTTPGGRQTTSVIDTLGRVLQIQVPGLHAEDYAYDDRGRLMNITRGNGDEARTQDFAYNSSGYLDTVTDSLNRTVQFSYDLAGRLTRRTLADGRVIHYTYDANGNVTSITPPGRPAHTFSYTASDLIASYTAPDVGSGSSQTTYTYNADGQLTLIKRPDGKTIEFDYEGAGCDCGRLTSSTMQRGRVQFTYDEATGQLTGVQAPGSVDLAYTYDGRLLTGTTWSGPVVGSVTRTHDNDFRLSSESVNGGSEVSFMYDDDGLLTQAGSLSINRDPQTGRVTDTTLDGMSDAWTYNGFGEVIRYTASQGGTTLLDVQYVYDTVGRIGRKIETIEGVTDTYDYSFDIAGRLVEVKRNDTTDAHYSYDTNDNRLTGTDSFGAYVGTYDNQDRVLTYGGASYTHTPNGELLTKTVGSQTTTHEYDTLGNLTAVALPDGTDIQYLVDGQNRRIAKKVNGTLVQAFLYKDDLNPVAELDGGGNLVSRFVYGTRTNVPNYMVRGGATYRIIADHLGSPRLVVDVAGGTIAQRMDYDAFGRVVQDTNPGFQPFGFAGGLYDSSTKLVTFGARDYDAEIGRWTVKDPSHFAGSIANLYVYALNDPVNLVDYTGLAPKIPTWVRSRWNNPDYVIIGGGAGPAGGVHIVDRFGRKYVGAGAGLSKTGILPGIKWASGWLKRRPCETDEEFKRRLRQFLAGGSVGASAYYVVGGGAVTNEHGTSFEVGFGTPNIGVEAGHTEEVKWPPPLPPLAPGDKGTGGYEQHAYVLPWFLRWLLGL